MKILMLSNQSRSMSIFWRVLIKSMRNCGNDIICCLPSGDAASENELRQMGCQIINYPLDRKGLNPLADLKTLIQLKKIFKTEKPDLIFATTIKPVIYGGIAASLANIPGFFATITGLGYAFEADSVSKKVIRKIASFLYKAGLGSARGIFFQNQDDAALFRRLGILKPDAPVHFAVGTGVDTNRFAPAPLPGSPITFLLICRLLEAKGLAEYAAAAKILKKRFPEARFQLLGPPETGRGSVSLEQVKEWEQEGAIEYLGEAKDVRSYLAAAHVAVLPSWREGTPTALMEAMSMARPLVATDAPGCREVVKDGVNGFLVEVKNPESLAKAMGHFLEQPDLIAKMGQASRELACSRFDANVVAAGILKTMQACQAGEPK